MWPICSGIINSYVSTVQTQSHVKTNRLVLLTGVKMLNLLQRTWLNKYSRDSHTQDISQNLLPRTAELLHVIDLITVYRTFFAFVPRRTKHDLLLHAAVVRFANFWWTRETSARDSTRLSCAGCGKQEDVFIYSQVNNEKTLMFRRTGSYYFLSDLVFVWIIPAYQLQNISFFTYLTFISFLP